MFDSEPPADIWSTGFLFDSPLKDLLDGGRYTIDQLLGEDELLQELRGCHPQLVEYFSTEKAVVELVRHVIVPPAAQSSSSSVDHRYGAGISSAEPPPVQTPTEEAAETEPDIVDVDIDEKPGNGEKESRLENDTKWETQDQEQPRGGGEANEANEANDTNDTNGGIKSETKSEDEGGGGGGGKEKDAPSITEDQQLAEGRLNPEAMSQKELADLETVRYPYMACEVICSEVSTIIDTLVSGRVVPEREADTGGPFLTESQKEPLPGAPESGAMDSTSNNVKSEGPDSNVGDSILDLLFSLLYDTQPGDLDDYRAGYFDKIVGVLCRKRPQEMSAYINEGGSRGQMTLMNAMLKHLYSHSILQVVQRFLLPPPAPGASPPVAEGQGEQVNTEANFMETQEVFGGAPPDEDELASLFRCRWSESPEAVDILLNCLVGNGSLSSRHDEELRLNEAQNASEVLITIIQNSPLTSPTLVMLTSDPVLERIAKTASELPPGEAFGPHDCALTCALNVFESLVLQLGGYGTVGTIIEGEMDGGEDGDDTNRREVATAETLLKHLPRLLENLASLLKHPSTGMWTSPSQFSKEEPQLLLGTSRLRIVRLIESLVLLGNGDADKVLCESNCLAICLDLFWHFEWCSMLHQSVANLLVHVFEGANARSALQEFFLVKCDLLTRLIDCFEEDDTSPESEVLNPNQEALLLHSVSAMKEGENGSHVSNDSIAAKYEGSSDGEVLPVSDDDVDAALEQQEEATSQSSVARMDPETEVPPVGQTEDAVEIGKAEILSHLPSLRKGYMGHVIIVCQALVHACGPPSHGHLEESNPDAADSVTKGESTQNDVNNSECPDLSPPSDDGVLEEDDGADSESPPSPPLVIAQLIQDHPVKERWQEFVATTLAAENAIQSTPLGGTNAAAVCVDPLMSHRPALNDLSEMFDDPDDDDDDDDDDDEEHDKVAGGPVEPDDLNMDDNDIEVAVGMMEDLDLPPTSSSGAKFVGSDFNREFETQKSNEYMFDDPLGSKSFDAFKGDSDSSDEDEDGAASPKRQSSADVGPPVMDLFAGNFVNGPGPTEDGSGAGWSDFANFDDAFATGGTTETGFANFDDAFTAKSSGNGEPPVATETVVDPSLGILDGPKDDVFGSPASTKETIDDIFGTAPHALLLDDPVESDKTKNIQDPEPQDDTNEPSCEDVNMGATSSEEDAS